MSSSFTSPAPVWVLVAALLAGAAGVIVWLLIRRRTLERLVIEEAAEYEDARRALEAAEARYRGVYSAVSDGLLILDEEGLIQEANPVACTMFGLHLGELHARPIQDLCAPGNENTLAEIHRQLRERDAARVDASLRRGDGTFDVEARASRFVIEGERQLLLILTDVSGRQEAVHRHASLSRKVLMAQEKERARVSRELHDELGQVLTALRFELDFLRRKICPTTEGAKEGFDNALYMVENAADELRRICRGLRPPLLDDLGLGPAMRSLVEDLEQHTHMPITLNLDIPDDPKCVPQEASLCCYRVAQEALHNACRHSGGKEINVTLSLGVGDLQLSVYNDGRGFDLEAAASGEGSGIGGMRERAHLVGGTLEIHSQEMQGARVLLKVPLPDRVFELEER